MHIIYVVDDDATCREMVCTALRKQGNQVAGAASASEALQLLETARPHLIVLDAQMPNTDGVACLRAIRRDARFRLLPVMVLTRRSSKDFILAITELGIHDYLLKDNLSMTDLVGRVNRCLASGPRLATSILSRANAV